MESSVPEERPGRFRAIVNTLARTIAQSYTAQCLLLLHFISWSAESTIHAILLLAGVLTIIFFSGCRHLARLAYETAMIFSTLVFILKGVLRITFIFTLYEVILEIFGYHSRDYKEFKHSIESVITEFSTVTCTWVLNTTTDGRVVLGTHDVIYLCHTIWYMMYILVISMGLYMGIPDHERIRKEYFWSNVYLTVMMVVVWKMFENFLWYGWWQSAELHRVTCVYMQYVRYGEGGFTSAVFKQ